MYIGIESFGATNLSLIQSNSNLLENLQQGLISQVHQENLETRRRIYHNPWCPFGNSMNNILISIYEQKQRICRSYEFIFRHDNDPKYNLILVKNEYLDHLYTHFIWSPIPSGYYKLRGKLKPVQGIKIIQLLLK